MNVIKHMEAAFLVTLSVAGAACIVVDTLPPAQAHAVAPAAVATSPNIPVVHVTAKRMSTIERLRSLADDMRGSRA